MMDKLEKVVDLLELIVEKLLRIFLLILNKIIPEAVKLRVASFNKAVKLRSHQAFNQSKDWLIKQALKAKEISLRYFSKLKSVLNYPLQDNVNKSFAKTTKFLKTTPLRSVIELLSKFLRPRLERLQARLNKIVSTQFYIAAGSLFMILGGITGIYFSANDIIEKEYPYRAPASNQEYDIKPDYLQFKEKTLKVQNIKLPLQVEKAGKISSFTIDFTIRTSTKFAAYYLENNEYKLKDYFFTSVNPIDSDLVIDTESKDILKDKIRREINDFLESQRVEGVVDEVDIQFIIGS